ncbi:MAG: hypothetical protein RR710_04195 [Oscillospiraceae bacterium]
MKMKKIVIALLALSLLAGCGNKQPCNDSTYNMDGKVSAIDSESVEFVTDDGNIWAIDYKDGFQLNQNVSIILDDMGTESIYDDTILEVK